MNSSEYQCAQRCYILLEELLSHLELRAQNDNLRCAVCGSLLYFHKRGSSNLLSSSISPCIPVASTSSCTSYIESPNQKMGMASDHLSPTQSTFVVPIQSSSFGNGSSLVNNGGNPFPILMYTTLRSVLDARKICSQISKEKQLNLIWLVK